jgi:hypothetical protein
MRINQNEDYIRIMQQLSSQRMNEVQKNPTTSREPINDNFSRRDEARPAVEFSFSEAVQAHRQAAIDAASGEEKNELQMRKYWSEYNDIFSGGSPNGWASVDLEKMYAQADEIYKQIEQSGDDDNTKSLKKQALENALKQGTGMYSMNKVAEKQMNDAKATEARGEEIDRSFRSKDKFDKLSAMSGAYHDITQMFFNNLKNGMGQGFDYAAMISSVTDKIMSYENS